MTDDVAALVLRDNYFQTQALSVARRARRASCIDQQARFIRFLEKSGRLNRAIEFLPDDDEIAERKARGIGLTSPERAVLLAYSKMWLFDELARLRPAGGPVGRAPRSRATSRRCCARSSAPTSRAIRCEREIIATHVLNSMVNRVGATFVHRLTRAHRREAGAGGARLPGDARGVRLRARCGSRSRRSTTRCPTQCSPRC